MQFLIQPGQALFDSSFDSLKEAGKQLGDGQAEDYLVAKCSEEIGDGIRFLMSADRRSGAEVEDVCQILSAEAALQAKSSKAGDDWVRRHEYW